MQKQIQNRNRFNLKNWLLVLGCLAGPMLYAGDDYFSDDEDDDYLSLEDWYKLEDWEKVNRFDDLSSDDQLRMDTQEGERIQKIIKENKFKKRLKKELETAYKRKSKSSSKSKSCLTKWKKLNDERKESCFSFFSKEDQLKIWKTLDPDQKARYYRNLCVELRQQLFSDLDEAMQEQYLSGHHKASRVRF